ncbi:3-hydroxybutyryl-CoA dehydratase [Alkalispirillum mobile]|uniref:3-hydroxybutyryl-CoA dehydratase n=1 Tax=Alkalispirillum mobile TaxID=85925 RepID=A0A498BVQ2_9GAMM|nr:MaoC family dehydratase [Alkalispirillum mobile]RLK46979.1 3-hydroxybutyryl-CoA dehydratase [Alkalispirillum mobile]
MMMDEYQGYYIEDLEEGMSGSYAKTVTEADVVLYAGLSGDNNPVHINEEFASNTFARGRIVHGMYLAGLISCVLGTRLPGPGAIYLDQFIKFKAPVRIGDTVKATATVRAIDRERKRITLETVCTVKGRVVVVGEATVLVASRAEQQETAAA